METKTKYLQLPFLFDTQKLQKDLEIIFDGTWSPMLYKHNYEGGWKSIALYAPDGNSENIAAHGITDIHLKPTAPLLNCHYFQEVINSFQAPLLSVRLLRLSVGSIIKPHKDHRMGYENDNFRIHIPIITNDQVTFILDDEKLQLLPGQCWYINANFTHAVSNFGIEDRVHLVIDLERNPWSDSVFFSLAPKETLVDHEEPMSTEAMENLKAQFEKSGVEIPDYVKNLQKK